MYMQFRWMKNPAYLMPNDIDGHFRGALVRARVRIEFKALANMRRTKKWKNRTHQLMDTMTSKASTTGYQLRVTLTEHMYYGVYVETRWGGRYQSLLPAVEMTLPEALAITLEEVMKR